MATYPVNLSTAADAAAVQTAFSSGAGSASSGDTIAITGLTSSATANYFLTFVTTETNGETFATYTSKIGPTGTLTFSGELADGTFDSYALAVQTLDLSGVTTFGTAFNNANFAGVISLILPSTIPGNTFSGATFDALMTLDLTGVTSFGASIFNNAIFMILDSLTLPASNLNNAFTGVTFNSATLAITAVGNNLGGISADAPTSLTLTGTLNASSFTGKAFNSLKTLDLSGLTSLDPGAFTGASFSSTIPLAITTKDGHLGGIGVGVPTSLMLKGNLSVSAFGVSPTFTKLTTLDLSGVTGTFDANAFNGATLSRVTSLTLPSTTPDSAFTSHTFGSPLAITTANGKLGGIPVGTPTSLTIKGVLAASAFTGETFTNLTTLDLLGVTSFGNYAFIGADLSTVATLRLPDSTPGNAFKDATFGNPLAITTANGKLGAITSDKITSLTITGTLANSAFDNFSFDNLATLDLLGVTSLGTGVFRSDKFDALSSLTLPALDISTDTFKDAVFDTGITLTIYSDVGARAFEDAIFTTLDITLNSRKIGANAFKNMSRTGGNITLTLYSDIGNNAFEGAGLAGTTTLNLSHVSDMGIGVFSGAYLADAMTLTLPHLTLPAYTFSDADLSGLTILAPVSDIGQSAFEGANLSGLTTLNLPAGKYVADNAFKNAKMNTLGILTLSGVSDLGDAVFEAADLSRVTNLALPHVKIPASTFHEANLSDLSSLAPVSDIGDSAFEGANLSSLTALTFPSDKYVDQYAFYTADIRQLQILNLSPLSDLGERVFQDAILSDLISLIPPTSKPLPAYAFNNAQMPKLKTLNLSTGAGINANAFQNADLYSLEQLILPAVVPTNAFNGATISDLKSLDLSHVTAAIPADAFTNVNLNSVSDIKLPAEGAQSFIKEHKFPNLYRIAFAGTRLIDQLFSDKDLSRITTLDFSTPSLSDFIGSSAFENADLSSLANMIGLHVKTIKSNAFKNANLSALSILNLSGVSDIQSNAFESANFSKINTIYWPTIGHIGNNAFKGANFMGMNRTTALASLPSDVASDAFAEAIFKDVVLNQRDSDISRNEAIQMATLPTVKNKTEDSINPGTFANLTMTTKRIEFTAAITVGDAAFAGTTASDLRTLSLPRVTALGVGAFSDVTMPALRTIALPKVTSIGRNAFAGADFSDLRTLSLPAITGISDQIFSSDTNLSHLKTLSLPRLTTLGGDAFKDAPLGNLKKLCLPRITLFSDNPFQGADLSGLVTLCLPALQSDGINTVKGLFCGIKNGKDGMPNLKRIKYSGRKIAYTVLMNKLFNCQ